MKNPTNKQTGHFTCSRNCHKHKMKNTRKKWKEECKGHEWTKENETLFFFFVYSRIKTEHAGIALKVLSFHITCRLLYSKH